MSCMAEEGSPSLTSESACPSVAVDKTNSDGTSPADGGLFLAMVNPTDSDIERNNEKSLGGSELRVELGLGWVGFYCIRVIAQNETR